MKAILVFCEGRHDVVFVKRSLGATGGCDWLGGKIQDLPSPFGHSPVGQGMIATHLGRSAVGDLDLQTATHPPLPALEAVLQNVESRSVFFLFRAHGKDQTAPIADFLDKLNAAMEIAGTVSYDVSRYAVAFVYDANEVGVAGTLNDFRQRYRKHFGDLADLQHGTWIATDRAPVGCFVFGEDVEGKGTLEDHLEPMVASAWPDKYSRARDFVDEYRNQDDKVSSSRAARTKAAITVAGQFSCPGAPMSMVIDRPSLSGAAYLKSPTSRTLAKFLISVPWEPTLDPGYA